MEVVTALLAIKWKALIAGTIGAVLSLRFFDGLNMQDKFTTAAGGAASANYLTEPAMQFFGLTPATFEGGLGFIIGLFGMSIAAAVVRTIRDTNWAEWFKFWKKS